MKWKRKIYDHEVPPPEHIWDRISHDLDNGDFVICKEKLFHAEATLPPETWSKISQDLDNEQFLAFKEKLFYTEAPPPTDTWKHIEAQLSETKVVPVRRKNNLLVKVMAAAGLVGIMFFAANYLMVHDGEIETVTANQTGVSPEKTENKEQEQGETPSSQEAVSQPSRLPYTVASGRVARKNNDMPETEHAHSFEYDQYPRYDRSLSSVAVENTFFTDKTDLSGSFNRKIRNRQGEIKEDVSLLDLPNSYFMMTGPNGQSMRVSSKFRNTIQYLNAEGKEEWLDVILRESWYWKSVFKDWKDKVGNSSFVPTVDNFMDIAELMKLIQEPQEEKQ